MEEWREAFIEHLSYARPCVYSLSCIRISRGYTWRQVLGAGIPFLSKSFKQHVSTQGFISSNTNPCFSMVHFHGSTMRFSFFFFFSHKACEILVPQPGSEPRAPALEAQNLNHCTVGKSLANVF